MDISGQVQTEFQYADFGDTRLPDQEDVDHPGPSLHLGQ